MWTSGKFMELGEVEYHEPIFFSILFCKFYMMSSQFEFMVFNGFFEMGQINCRNLL
jgi:hypothetical protein